MPLDQSFDDVLLAARAGGEWAWAEIYRDLAPVVLGYLRGQGAAEPEDVTGEVFVQVVRDLPRFDGDERAFRAWVFTIAHHRLVDAGRHAGRRPVDPTSAETIAQHMPVGDAQDDALDALAGARVRELLGTLSLPQREVLLLRILGDLTVEQVARVVGRRPGAVKALQRRGLATLKRELSKQGVPL